MKKECEGCGRIFTKPPSDSKTYWQKRRFCSLPCSGTLIKKGQVLSPRTLIRKGQVGEASPAYKGGRGLTAQGYVRVLVPGVGYKLEHRLVMEKALGRKLERWEHVHHKDDDKTNNRPENLQVLSIWEHNRKHTTERWRSETKPFRRNLRAVK